MTCALGAVSCCLGCVPAQFHVVESDVFGMSSGFAGREISEEEGGMRLMSSSTYVEICDFAAVCGFFALKISALVSVDAPLVTLTS